MLSNINYANATLNLILTYMNDNISRGFSIKDLTAYSGVNKTTIESIFKRNFGMGAIEYFISMKTELANLNAEKERLLAEYKAARTEAQEYDTVKQNVDALLAVPKEQEQQRRHELE